MKLAITVWDERISPVYDSAHTLLIAHIKNKKITRISYQSFDPTEENCADRLEMLGIRVLICGAVSKSDAALIQAKNIHLIPFIKGDVNQVLDAYVRGNSLVPVFLMPGCRRQVPSK